MDISIHPSNFNSAQMATDQREGGPDDLSVQTVTITSSPAGIYQNSPPHYNPCTLENWPRHISQPGFMPSFQTSQYAYPVVGTDPYNMAPSHQDLSIDQTNYIDAYTPSHVNPIMDSPDMSMVADVKEQFLHDDNLNWKPSTFKTEEYYPHQVQYGTLQPIQNSPPSPLSTISSYPSPQSFAAGSPARTGRTTEQSGGDTKEDRAGNPPYSILIYQALKNAEGNKLSLQGIYRWFEENTEKARDSSHKGWQNSIRHNLSMNAGFEAVKEDMGPGKKTINFWRLTPDAIKEGTIQSTTRYRRGSRKANGRVSRRDSGSRERHASKKVKTSNASKDCPQAHIETDYLPMEFSSMPYMHNPIPSGLPNLNNTMAMPRFGMGHVTGCTSQFPENNGVFVDGGLEPDFASPFAMGHSWYAPGPHDRAATGSNTTVDLHATI